VKISSRRRICVGAEHSTTGIDPIVAVIIGNRVSGTRRGVCVNVNTEPPPRVFLHHPRDTVLGEDASRSRKGAAGLMYLLDVLINLLHLSNRLLLRSVRHFSANVHELYKLLCGS